MGILRHREELLPVTCAVLSEADRNAFFSQLKKNCGGRVEKIATVGGTNKSTVSDWMSGKANIPYHALQRLSREFKTEMPPVGELRREYQAVVEVRATPGPSRGNAESRPREKPEMPERPAPPRAEERPEKAQNGTRRERPGRAAKSKRPERERPAPRREGGPSLPKLTDKAAYWSGATLAGARRDGDAVTLKIDPRVGPNFTAAWAKLSEEIFGAKVLLKELEEAVLPVKGLEEFIDRLELKEGQPAPGAPRWAWSNPAWKIAFLRGVIDASAIFKHDPALEIIGLSERLVQSITKLLNALGLEVKPDEQPGAVGEPSIVLEGEEALKRYFLAVGTENFKLKDQFKAFFKEELGDATPPATTDKGAKKKPQRRGGKGRGRGRGRARQGPRAQGDRT